MLLFYFLPFTLMAKGETVLINQEEVNLLGYGTSISWLTTSISAPHRKLRWNHVPCGWFVSLISFWGWKMQSVSKKEVVLCQTIQWEKWDLMSTYLNFVSRKRKWNHGEINISKRCAQPKWDHEERNIAVTMISMSHTSPDSTNRSLQSM